MRLSIITINYNNKQGLEKTLKSISKQSFKEFEHIVIDGGSADGSAELLKKNSARFAYWVSEPDRGVYHAMNKGAAVTKGDYLLFLNSGDCLCEAALSNFFAEQPQADLIYAKIRYVGSDRIFIQDYPSTIQFSFIAKHSLPHPATLIRRDLLYKIGLYDETLKITSDWKFFILAICCNGASYLYKDFVAVDFDNSGMSSQGKNLSLIQKERDQVLKEFFSCYLADLKNLNRLENLDRLIEKLGRSYLMKFLIFFGFFKLLKKSLNEKDPIHNTVFGTRRRRSLFKNTFRVFR